MVTTILSWTILAILISNIVLDAIADGIRDRDLKNPTDIQGRMYHLIWVASLVVLSTLALVQIEISEYIIMIGAWGLLRFGIFDYIRNIFAGKHYMYIGDTASTDKIIQWFNTPNRKGLLMVIKAACFIVGVALIQIYL